MVIGWVVMLFFFFFLLGRLAFGVTFYQPHSDMVLDRVELLGRDLYVLCMVNLKIHSESFRLCEFFRLSYFFRLSEIFRLPEIFRHLVLTNFPFPSILLKAQEYFGCGW